MWWIYFQTTMNNFWVMFRKWKVSPQNGKKPIWFLSSKKTKTKTKNKQTKKTKQKQELKNYRPIFLLPVSGKILERFLYEIMFTFFTKSSLTSQNQSRFKPGDSCTKQLLPITYQISKSFDDFYDVLRHFQRFW